MCRTAAQPYNMQVPSPSPERDGATTFIRLRTYISDREGGGNHGTGTSIGMAQAQDRFMHMRMLTTALSHCREHCRNATQPHCRKAALLHCHRGKCAEPIGKRAPPHCRAAALPHCIQPGPLLIDFLARVAPMESLEHVDLVAPMGGGSA